MTSPAVIKWGGMSQALRFLSAELIKVLLPMKKLLTVLSTSPLNRDPRHGGYSLFSISTSSLLLPQDFDTASFLHFSNRELNELAVSLKVWTNWIKAGPSNSSRASNMSVVRSSA